MTLKGPAGTFSLSLFLFLLVVLFMSSRHSSHTRTYTHTYATRIRKSHDVWNDTVQKTIIYMQLDKTLLFFLRIFPNRNRRGFVVHVYCSFIIRMAALYEIDRVPSLQTRSSVKHVICAMSFTLSVR